MAVTSIANKLKSGSLLVGNEAYDPGAFVSIATVTLTSDGTGVTFSNIPSTYKHLQIRGVGKTATTANGPSLFFNNVTSGGQYAFHDIYAQADGAKGGQGYTSQGYIGGGNLMYSGQFGPFIWDFLDYKDSNKYKTVRWFSGVDTNGVVNSYSSVWLGSGLWMSTNAITQIDVFNGYTWKAGTTFALYGIKG